MPCKRLVLIGVSTGGPRAMRSLFRGLGRLDAAVIVVQHMPRGINASVRKSLDALTDMDVVLAENGSPIDAGTVYVAPSDIHLQLRNNDRINLVGGEQVCFVRPSADVMMISATQRNGVKLIGIVLTGMGRDGTDGIRHIKAIGGTTVAQDEHSCAIYGMPKAATATGCVDFVLSPEQIRERLTRWAGVLTPA